MYLENNLVKKYPVKVFLAWFAVLCWMGVIFFFSHQPGDESQLLSGRVTSFLLQLLESQPGAEAVARLEQTLRQWAHGVIFCVLSLLVSWAFLELKVAIWPNIFLTLLISAVYAAFDELHQLFIPGRTGQIRDFLIDLAGIGAGIALFQAVSTVRYLRQDLFVSREEDLRL